MTNPSNAALPYNYKWRDAERALKEICASGHRDAHDGVLLEYSHPITGGPTMPTIGCWVQMIPPGESTKPHRHTSSTIYHVVQGDGVTTVGQKKATANSSPGAPTIASSCRPGTGTRSRTNRQRNRRSSSR